MIVVEGGRENVTTLNIYAPKSRASGDFHGGAVAKTPHSQCRGLGLTPGQGARSHMLPLRVCMPQLKILHAAAKTWCVQINIFKNEKTRQPKRTIPTF